MVKAVIFDLDDTLYDQSSYIRQGFNKIVCKVQNDFDLNKKEKNTILKNLEQNYEKGCRNRIFNRVLEELFPKISARALNDYIERELLLFYKLAPRKLNLFLGVLPLFLFLKRKNIRIALVTQGHPINQMCKIFQLGIFDYFDAIEISGNYPPKKAKPSSFLYKRILNKLNLRSNEVICVGDDLETDIGAVKAGIRLYYLNRRKDKKTGNSLNIKIIHDLSEIRKLV